MGHNILYRGQPPIILFTPKAGLMINRVSPRMLDGDLRAVMRAGQEFQWDRIPFILEDRFMNWLGETMGCTIFSNIVLPTTIITRRGLERERTTPKFRESK